MWSRNYFTAKNPSCCPRKEQTGSLWSPTQENGHPAIPTVSALTHPKHSQPFSARQWIWVCKDDTANTETAWEMWTMFIIHALCHICITGQEKARNACEMSSGAWPAQVHTTEQRRSPVNRCSLLATLVGVSCNTGTQTLTVPTKIAVACVCVTIFDKRSHINLGGEKTKTADLIAWTVHIPVAAGVLLLDWLKALNTTIRYFAKFGHIPTQNAHFKWSAYT